MAALTSLTNREDRGKRGPQAGGLREIAAATILFFLVLAAYLASRNVTSFDSRWTVYTALSLLHEGDINLDEYLPLLERDRFYGIECVKASGERIYPVIGAAQCASGHFYNFYPSAVAALAAPGVLALEAGLAAARPLLRPALAAMPEGPRKRFLSGNLAGVHPMVELLLASLIVAAAAAFMFLSARDSLPRAAAFLIALLFAFCTPAWSTGSRALWQHGPSMLLLAVAIWLILKSGKSPGLSAAAGLPLALAFFVRPTNAVPLALLSLAVLVHWRRRFPAFLLWMIPPVLVFCGMNLAVYGHVLAPYSAVSRAGTAGLSLHAQFGEALAGNLVSPARGLFVYVPLFLLSLYGVFLPAGSDPARRIRPYLAAVLPLHWLLISSYEDWWGGDCFGPRYFADITPIFVYFLIPVAARIQTLGVRRAPALSAVFVLLAGASFFVHYRGATSWRCMDWNVNPRLLREDPSRIWDWKDPQFLRGIGRR